VIFVETEVVPALVVEAQHGNSELIIEVCKELATRAAKDSKSESSQSYLLTLEYFVKKMVDPGEDFPPELKPAIKVNDFEQIFI